MDEKTKNNYRWGGRGGVGGNAAAYKLELNVSTEEDKDRQMPAVFQDAL